MELVDLAVAEAKRGVRSYMYGAEPSVTPLELSSTRLLAAIKVIEATSSVGVNHFVVSRDPVLLMIAKLAIAGLESVFPPRNVFSCANGSSSCYQDIVSAAGSDHTFVFVGHHQRDSVSKAVGSSQSVFFSTVKDSDVSALCTGMVTPLS